MDIQDELLVTADLHPLSGLQHLALYSTRAAARLELDDACSLPPSLTQLNLQRATRMFSQVGPAITCSFVFACTCSDAALPGASRPPF